MYNNMPNTHDNANVLRSQVDVVLRELVELLGHDQDAWGLDKSYNNYDYCIIITITV